MKKYLLICVTYHSDKELRTFLESVHRAAEQVKGKMQVDIEVADNGKHNPGYLGGALPVYNAKAQDYDYVSISNVDMVLASDFFTRLLAMDHTGAGWIAPDIYTEKIHRHENPYMLRRPTRFNFFVWHIIYSSTLIYRIYHMLHLWKSKRHKIYPSCAIYAGHGSFMLFTRAFVKACPEIHFPGFMYCEEIYMAELQRSAGLTVLYEPALRIANTGSVSTRLVRQAQKSQWNKQSLCAIQKLFF